MNAIWTLLTPRFLGFKNRSRMKSGGGSAKLLLLGGVGAAFWGVLFAVSLRVLSYFKGIEEIGDILSLKLLSMVLLTSFALLIFSGVLTSLSKLYLSKDLPLVFSMPVAGYQVFTARWIDSMLDGSWMVVLYTLPILISYGIVEGSGVFYFCSILPVLVLLSMVASAVSSLLILVLVMLIPANRMKNIVIFVGLFLFVILYIAFRMLKPELLVDPEVFSTVLIYIRSLNTPSSPYLPSTWAFDALRFGLDDKIFDALFHMAVSTGCAGALICVLLAFADGLYVDGFSKTQTASSRYQVNKMKRTNTGSGVRFKGPKRAFIFKEIKTFLRDQTQWSQLFLIGALIVIYIYNFKVLPLEKSPIKTIYLQNLFSFLNMGLALFVLTAVSARFAYPAVSTEGEAFWIVQSGPIRLTEFLWIKFFIYYIPLLILAEVLIIVTNVLLHVTPFMMLLSTVTVFLLVPGIVSLAVGLGAAFPDFKAENPTQTVTGFGGILYMTLSALYIGGILIIESGPVYNIFMAGIRNQPLSDFQWIWTISSFFAILVISALMVVYPLKFGEKKLSAFYT